jgi:hypothetical protein
MISAYGPRAHAFARGLGDIDAVIAEFPYHVQALPEAIRRRTEGRAFYGMVLHDDARQHAILRLAGDVIGTASDYDTQRGTLTHFANGTLSVNGKASREIWETASTPDLSIGEFLSVATAALARSFAEWTRLRPVMLRPRPFEIAVGEPALPAFERAPAATPSVVVWWPDREARMLAWHAFALKEFRGEVTCVCAGGSAPPGGDARFLAAGDPAVPEALARAHVIVCPDLHDPGAAVAFARHGYGIVAPYTSGAHQFVRDVATYGDLNLYDIPMAAAIALTRPASVRFVPPPPPALARSYPLPARIDARPLVSVIIPTYNRADDLERCLACVQAQTYAPLETIVVNDCGENVDAIVARFPNARVLDLTENGGAIKAVNAGLAQARGAYVQLIADDDIVYPDHIERLMAAMLASGAAVAHGNTIIHYQRVEADGRLTTTGFNMQTFNDTALPTVALVSTPIAGNALLFRADVLAEIGTFRDDSILADQEFQLRAAARYVFAYVDQMTAEWRVRPKANFSSQADSYAGLRKVYEEMHPLPDRPIIERQRAVALENVRTRPKGSVFPPTFAIEAPAAEPRRS